MNTDHLSQTLPVVDVKKCWFPSHTYVAILKLCDLQIRTGWENSDHLVQFTLHLYHQFQGSIFRAATPSLQLFSRASSIAQTPKKHLCPCFQEETHIQIPAQPLDIEKDHLPTSRFFLVLSWFVSLIQQVYTFILREQDALFISPLSE